MRYPLLRPNLTVYQRLIKWHYSISLMSFDAWWIDLGGRWTHGNRFLTHTDNCKLSSWAKGILDYLKLTHLLVLLHTDSMKWKNKTFKHLLSITEKDNEKALTGNCLFKHLGNFLRVKNCICEKDICFDSIFLCFFLKSCVATTKQGATNNRYYLFVPFF